MTNLCCRIAEKNIEQVARELFDIKILNSRVPHAFEHVKAEAKKLNRMVGFGKGRLDEFGDQRPEKAPEPAD